MATHVDDTLVTGNSDFEEETYKTGTNFETKPGKFNNTRFSGTKATKFTKENI